MSKLPPTIPEGLDLVQTSDGVIIRRKWLSWGVLPMAIFAGVWDSFLVFWYTMAFKASKIIWIMVVFPIGHLAVGIGITYFVISSLFNKTDVTVTLSRVEVRTYPLLYPGNKSVRAGDITEIIVRQRAGRSQGGNFDVMYADQSRKERKLVSFSQPDQAEFVANAIRTAIDLKPQET